MSIPLFSVLRACNFGTICDGQCRRCHMTSFRLRGSNSLAFQGFQSQLLIPHYTSLSPSLLSFRFSIDIGILDLKPRFSLLYSCRHTIRITRPYIEFLKGLVELKTRFLIKLDQNTLLAVVVQDTLYLTQQDNNIYIINKTKDF